MEGGHEIGHHGYLHEDPTEHSSAEQTYWFERALEAHRQAAGRAPRGYRAPIYNITPAVIDLLCRRILSEIEEAEAAGVLHSGARQLLGRIYRHHGEPDRARQILEKLEEEGDSVKDALVESKDDGHAARKQLTLFESPKDKVLRELSRLDLDQLTPIQALQKLAEWADEL